jgi:hypothetical protein
MIEIYLPLFFALVIAITYYHANRYNVKLTLTRRKHSTKVLSFAAGISITYVLLELIPTFTKIAFSINKALLISIPLGFIFHHLLEKEIYQHTHKHELIRIISFEENFFSYFYHLILGVILVIFAKEGLISGILSFIPLLTFTIVNTLPMGPHPTKSKTLLMSSSTVVGVIITSLWKTIPFWLEIFLMGLATGILLYTVIRHHIPFGKKGKIGYFTLSFILYTLLIMITWYI